MAFSGGTFSRTFDCTTDRDNGVKILASKFDTELDGFATGLSTCILKDGTQTCTAAIPFAEGLTVPDNKTIVLGTNSDITIQYDESTNDSLEIAANVEGAALGIVLKADQGDDNADQHKLNIADGGVLTLASKISGSFVDYLTHTPNSTVASSTTAVAGNLTVGGDLTLGSGAVISEAELEAIDGVTAGTVAASKAVIVDSNKDIASFRNVTLTGELDAGSLDISGDADIDGTLEADAMTLNGTAITATATLDTGISNNNVPKFTSGVADDDFLRVAGTAIEGRSASEVLSDIGALPLTGGSMTGAVTMTTADNTTQLTLTSTDADSGVGPRLDLKRDSGSPADNDALGRVRFLFDNDAGQETEAILFTGIVSDVSDGTEDAKFTIATMIDGTNRERVAMTNTEVVFNDDSIDSDFRVESNGNANMLFVDAGNDRVGIGTNSPASGSTLNVSGHVRAENSAFLAGRENASAPAFSFHDDSDTGIFNVNANILGFSTAGSERARINGNGELLINGTSNVGIGRISINFDRGTHAGIELKDATSSAARMLKFRNTNGTVGEIVSTGSSTAYATSSDYRLKENVADMTGSIDRVKALAPKRFNFIADADTTVDGFLAHEAQTVVPEAITGTKDAMKDEEYIVNAATGDIYTPAASATYDEDGEELTAATDEVIHSSDAKKPEELADGQQWRETTAAVMGTRSVPDYQGIDQSKLVPLLTGALREAIAKIETLETKVAALEAAP